MRFAYAALFFTNFLTLAKLTSDVLGFEVKACKSFLKLKDVVYFHFDLDKDSVFSPAQNVDFQSKIWLENCENTVTLCSFYVHLSLILHSFHLQVKSKSNLMHLQKRRNQGRKKQH